MFIWNFWTLAEHSLPLSVCTILGSGESLQISMYLLAFHEDCHKFTTGLDQGWKGCFFLPNVVIKTVASEEREIHLSCHFEFLCVQIQSYKHISGGCWDPPELETEGESLLCVICNPEMSPFYQSWGPSSEHLKNTQATTTSTTLLFFWSVSSFLFHVIPSLFGDSETYLI